MHPLTLQPTCLTLRSPGPAGQRATSLDSFLLSGLVRPHTRLTAAPKRPGHSCRWPPPYLMTSRLGAVGLTGDQCDGAGAVALALPRGKTPTDLDVTTEKWEDKRPGRPVCRITKSCPGLAEGQWREGSERLCPGDLAGPISPLLDCLHRSTHSLSGAP